MQGRLTLKHFVLAMAFLYLCVLLVMRAGTAFAGELPLWEAGVGIGGITLPDYRGSDQQRLYAFPVPYLVYRGEILKIDRKSVRGLLFQSDRLEMDVSLNASPPVYSGRNRAREGMPDLDPTGEVGPSLVIRLGESPLLGARVSVHLPVRVVVASDLTYLRQVGYVFNPRINFDWPLDASAGRWKTGLTMGPLYDDKKYNDYFYSVAPAYATAARPSYSAPGGYGGFQATASVNKRFEKTWFGAFFRADDLHRAVFEDSPLVRSRYAVMAGFAFSWVLDTSSEKVVAEE